MDLSAIKKNIESGVIRTTAEFQRDIMLMFQNAVMYNSSDHDVYHMALEMQRDVLEHVQQFLATQLIMQTSESAISAKSLRGREGNRKPGEPAEKVGVVAHRGGVCSVGPFKPSPQSCDLCDWPQPDGVSPRSRTVCTAVRSSFTLTSQISVSAVLLHRS